MFVNGIDWCTTVKIAPVSELEGKEGLPWTGSSELRRSACPTASGAAG